MMSHVNKKFAGFFVALGVVLAAAVGAAHAKPPDLGVIPPLVFDPPEAERRVLSNGVIVYILEDRELPLINLTLKMKTSPADEPAARRGAMSLMGTVWRTGGTRHRTSKQLNEELESMAAHVESGAGEESAILSLSCLSKDLDRVLDIYKDVLLNPVFEKAQLAVAKGQIVESIRRRNDDPWNIGRRAFRDVVYGKDHYYAWNPTEATVSRIRRSDLAVLHRRVVAPDHAILTVVGDFESADMILRLEDLLKTWRPTGRVVPEFDLSVSSAPAERLFLVEKDLTQSLIYIGGFGPTRHDPVLYAMTVANTILGSGGPSRLFSQVRSRLGLAYSVGSFYTAPRGPGLAGAATQTKAGSTVLAIQTIKREMAGLAENIPSADEMTFAKDSILNSFIFRFGSPSQIAHEQADLEFFGFPPDYLKTYPDKISGLSKDDVVQAARAHFDPAQTKVVVIGDPKRFVQPLSELGDVTELPLSQVD